MIQSIGCQRRAASSAMQGADAARPHIVYLVTEDWYFCMHWMRFAVAAQAEGFRVTVVTRINRHAEQIRAAGLAIEPLSLVRSSKNPLRDAASIAGIARLYRRLRPDIAHHIAVKPVLYGSLAARWTGVPAVLNTVAGLGYVFSSSDLRARLLRPFISMGYRLAFASRRHHLTVQNRDDLAYFTQHGTADPARAQVIPGVGVDVQRFSPTPEPPGPPLVVLPARLLRDKGVVEFVAAARLLRERAVRARFAVAGGDDPENPAAIPPAQVQAWKDAGDVEFWGWQQDMPGILQIAHVVCLPSYQEGLPTALIEAAACARPIVTCDVRGCREVVTHGENGLLVPPRDVAGLAAALERLIGDPALRARMGEHGRKRAVTAFSVHTIIAQTLTLYRDLVPEDRRAAIKTDGG